MQIADCQFPIADFLDDSFGSTPVVAVLELSPKLAIGNWQSAITQREDLPQHLPLPNENRAPRIGQQHETVRT